MKGNCTLRGAKYVTRCNKFNFTQLEPCLHYSKYLTEYIGYCFTDDWEPLSDADDYESQSRQNSAVKIRIVKNKECPVNQI